MGFPAPILSVFKEVQKKYLFAFSCSFALPRYAQVPPFNRLSSAIFSLIFGMYWELGQRESNSKLVLLEIPLNCPLEVSALNRSSSVLKLYPFQSKRIPLSSLKEISHTPFARAFPLQLGVIICSQKQNELFHLLSQCLCHSSHPASVLIAL